MIISIWFFGVMLTFFLLIADRLNIGNRSILKIAGVDSVSYFAVTHSLLFDHDFDLSNQYPKLQPTKSEWIVIQPPTGLPGSPFAIGFSLLELPFLFCGHVMTDMFAGEDDGYSPTCITSYFLGIIFYLCVGLTFLFLIVRALGNIIDVPSRYNDWISYAVVLGIWPSTTLAYYTFSPMSHIATLYGLLFILIYMVVCERYGI